MRARIIGFDRDTEQEALRGRVSVLRVLTPRFALDMVGGNSVSTGAEPVPLLMRRLAGHLRLLGHSNMVVVGDEHFVQPADGASTLAPEHLYRIARTINLRSTTAFGASVMSS